MLGTLLGGLLLMAVGTAWAAWAAWTLRRAGTPLVPRAAPRVLVEEGPYRLGRHPLYLGGLLAAAGLALVLGSLLLMAATVGALWLVARVLVPAEERQLARTFGGWYRDYAGSVRRWV